MFQDIEPHKFSCEFVPTSPKAGDRVLIYNDAAVMMKCKDNGGFELPTLSDLEEMNHQTTDGLQYLFSIDNTAFFLTLQKQERCPGFVFKSPQVFRKLEPGWLAFAGATAAHLGQWYSHRRFCGKCGAQLSHKPDERALLCKNCGLVEYPKIAPVVIAGVVDGDRLLLTRNAAGTYRQYALVAGYVEIGETLEDAVRREVLEEVGLHVKNIRYYKSQPWAFSGSLLSGFFAELDGSEQITLDTRELSEAVWLRREDIPPAPSGFSLTWTMIEAFRLGQAPKIDRTV